MTFIDFGSLLGRFWIDFGSLLVGFGMLSGGFGVYFPRPVWEPKLRRAKL